MDAAAPMPSDSGREDSSNPIEARYANHFVIGHNAFEFLLDFGQAYGDGSEPVRQTRIITNPSYAKAFLNTLKQSVDEHERLYGTIRGADE